MKKIYFACSIAGGRDQAHVYADIVSLIGEGGGTVLSTIFADKNLVSEVGTDPKMTPEFIWQRDCNWVREAGAIIAEVTQPSLGVGYEIAKAEEWNKPVLALFDTTAGRRLSPMISGNPVFTVIEYSKVEDVRAPIWAFLDKL